MPLDREMLHTWVHHWQDEYDAAYLYLVLAGQEPDQKRKDIYLKLAGVEERHVQMWEELLAEHGHPVGRGRPTGWPCSASSFSHICTCRSSTPASLM